MHPLPPPLSHPTSNNADTWAFYRVPDSIGFPAVSILTYKGLFIINWNIPVLSLVPGSKVNYCNIVPPTFPSDLLSLVDKVFIVLIIKAIHVYLRNKNLHNNIIINISVHFKL